MSSRASVDDVTSCSGIAYTNSSDADGDDNTSPLVINHEIPPCCFVDTLVLHEYMGDDDGRTVGGGHPPELATLLSVGRANDSICPSTSRIASVISPCAGCRDVTDVHVMRGAMFCLLFHAILCHRMRSSVLVAGEKSVI